MTADATACRLIIQAYGTRLRRLPLRRHYRLLAMGGRGVVSLVVPGVCRIATSISSVLLLGDVDN